MDIPKIIWSYWEDGADSAPDVVKHCLESWKKLNPDYEVRVLDKHTIGTHVSSLSSIDLFRKDITVVNRADIFRLALLSEHGGVWVDATLFCNTPLGDWLPDYTKSGFFAFRNEKKARKLCVWFLASAKGNILTCEFLSEYLRNFEETVYINQSKPYYKMTIKTLALVLNRNTYLSKFWVHPWVRNTLKMYPYFHMHYTFNNIIYRRGESARIWHSTPVYPRECSRHLRISVSNGTDMETIRHYIQNQTSPVHKMNWRSKYNSDRWREVFACLDAVVATAEVRNDNLSQT